MKERFLKVIKIFLMILGGLFLIQLLIILGAIIGLVGFANADLGFNIKPKTGFKYIQPIINYAENYKNENGIYPSKIEGVKIKKDLEYTYEVFENSNCYKVTAKYKKDNMTRQYQHCSSDGENSSSNSEFYTEYSE